VAVTLVLRLVLKHRNEVLGLEGDVLGLGLFDFGTCKQHCSRIAESSAGNAAWLTFCATCPRCNSSKCSSTV